MNRIIVKRTHEITPEEWRQIVAGFNEEFGKDKTAEDLRQFYCANSSGFSYHGFSVSPEGEIAGFTSVMPLPYADGKGKQLMTGLSGSSFVRKAFRNDIFIFHDIYKAIRERLQQEGIVVVLGVPNKNSYRYLIKLVGFRFLYNLPYYVLTVRPEKVLGKKTLALISPLYRAALICYTSIIRFFSAWFNPAERQPGFQIRWDDASYALRFHAAYTTVAKGNERFTYRVYEENGLRTAYLFDFRKQGLRCLRPLAGAIRYILLHEKADMIAFIGRLDLRQPLLLQLPAKKQPRELPLTVDLLVPDTHPDYAALSKPENWNFGLLNFDVR